MFRGWLVVACAFCSTLTFGISNSYSDFFIPLQQQFGWNAVTNSTVPAMSLIVFSLGVLISGQFANKVGSSRLAFFGSLLIGAGLLLSSQITDYLQLLVLFGTLTPLGCAFVVTVGTSLAVRWFHKKRGLAVGMAVAGSGVGTLALPPIAEFIIVKSGWRASFLAMGVAFLAVLLVVSYFLRTPEELSQKPFGWEELTHEERSRVKNYTLREVLRETRFWMIYAMFFLGTFGATIFIIHAAPFAMTHGIDPIVAAVAVGVLGAGSLLARIIMGIVSDIIERADGITIALAAELGGIAFLPFIGGSSLLLFACAFAIGFGYGGYIADFLALVGDLFGASSVASKWGIIETGYGLGGLLGPIIAGAYFASFGTYTGVLEIAALAMVAALIISIAFSRQVKSVMEELVKPT